MINLLSRQIKIEKNGGIMSKKAQKVFAWGMLIIMLASVVAGILAYAIR